MAIQWMEGFDHYGSGDTVGPNNMLAGPWASVSLAELGAPAWGARTGDNSLGLSFGTARRILYTPRAAVFVSMAFSVQSLPGGNDDTRIISFNDGLGLGVCQLYVTNTGRIMAVDKDDILLGITAGPVVTATNWHFVEMLYDCDLETFTLRIDDATGTETPVMSLTGLGDLGDIASITLGPGAVGASGGTMIWFDDVIVRDKTGGINDGWQGDRRVATLFANANEDTGWTPSYYQMFGTGILRLSYFISGDPSQQGASSNIYAGGSTQLDIGANDFTLETMIRFDKLPTTTEYSTIFSQWDAVLNRRSHRLVYGGPGFNNSCIQFDTSTDGTAGGVSTPIVYPWTPKTDTWYHIAVCRSAGELLLFVDGVQLGLPIADATTYYGPNSARFMIGAEQTNGNNNVITNSELVGYLDETRFTNGTGRYTATFTPPSAPFTRGAGDPDWAEVVLLMGYEGGIADESSFARTITARDLATSITPNDGPDLGPYSTVNKEAPDDGSFISASYANATNILTMTTQPTDGDTVTVGTTDGATPAVYRFKNTMSATFDVQIGASAQITLENLIAAINAGAGSGTAYFAGTTVNFDVVASELPVGQMLVEAVDAGVGGNSIASTDSGSATTWNSATLTGGASIPGQSSFKLQRPPRNTTIISGIQMVVRALKTDAGLASIQSTFKGGLGAETDGTVKNLTTSVSYYQDVIEEDPDTSGPITPTTLVNGEFIVNRVS